jgi:glycosyltransferase involved in cell wall biosynthesis
MPCSRKTDMQLPVQAPSIAFILPGIDAGGSEHVVTMLANAFADRMCNVTLATFAAAGAVPFYVLDRRVTFKPIGMPPAGGKRSRPLDVLRRVWRLRKAFKEIKPDLVISFLPRTNIVTLLSRPHCPIIISERNNAQEQAIGRIWQMMRRLLYPRASALVTMTAGAMKQFEEFKPPVTRVIPNHAAACRSGRKADGTSLVAVGRLVPQKGFDLLLEAFAKVAPAHPEWTLTIWGEGEERSALEQQRDSFGLRARVRLPGVTTIQGQWTEDADVFVLSSRFEGWGLVVGEALAAGIPTVAFNCDFGPAEMITHDETGILVPSGNVDALANELDRVIRNPALRRRLATAGQESMRRFAPEVIVNLWVDLVEQFVHVPAPVNECRDAA